MTSDTWLTLAQAAEATGYNRSTLWRALKREEFPRARKEDGDTDEGRWLVPVGDLEATKYRVIHPIPVDDDGPKRGAARRRPPSSTNGVDAAIVDDLRARVQTLEQKLEEEQSRAASLQEAVHAEKDERLRLADERAADARQFAAYVQELTERLAQPALGQGIPSHTTGSERPADANVGGRDRAVAYAALVVALASVVTVVLTVT